jgi:hypothetical protein
MSDPTSAVHRPRDRGRWFVHRQVKYGGSNPVRGLARPTAALSEHGWIAYLAPRIHVGSGAWRRGTVCGDAAGIRREAAKVGRGTVNRFVAPERSEESRCCAIADLARPQAFCSSAVAANSRIHGAFAVAAARHGRVSAVSCPVTDKRQAGGSLKEGAERLGGCVHVPAVSSPPCTAQPPCSDSS